MSSTSKKRKRNNNFQNKFNSLILKSTIVVFSFIMIMVLLFGLLIGTSLYGNYSKADSNSDKSTKIDFEKNNISILLIKIEDLADEYSLIQNVFLLNINLKDNTVGTFELPINMNMEYSDSLGQGDLEKLYAIANAENVKFEDVVKNTIFANYAVNIDKYIIVDNSVNDILDQTFSYNQYSDVPSVIRLKNITKIKQALELISESSRSNIIYVDALKLLNYLRNIDARNFVVISIKSVGGDSFNTLWRKYNSITDSLQSEQLKVFIANASVDPKIPGLAGWGKDVIENIGGKVMNIDNSFVELEENTIITNSLDYATYKQIAEQFGINNVILKDDIDITDGYNPEVYRSEISVYLVSY